MTLAQQCHSTWTALKRAKPRSKRRTKLEAEMINIQARRIKQELKRRVNKDDSSTRA